MTPVTPPVTLRALRPADLPALDRLLREVESVDRTEEHYSLADLEEEHADPLLDRDRDWVGAFDDDELVGSFRLFPRGPVDDTLLTYVTGCVHPARRGEGIGTVLAAAMVRRAEERHREVAPDLTALVRASGLTDDTAKRDLLAAVGLVPDRYSLLLEAAPLVEQEVGPFPAGLHVRAYDPDADEDLLRRTHNEVFRDHPGSSPWDEAGWRQWVSGARSFRPHLTFLVVEDDRPDEVAAYVQVEEYDAVLAATGQREAWVARVGTVRAHRGRGLAATLLRHTLEACRRDGLDRAGLNVDSANPTGALGVYERAGFRLERRFTDHLRTIPPLR